MKSTLLALEKLCKWRAILAGWHGGSMFAGQPGSAALRDEAELRLLLRVELTALTQLLIDRGVFTHDEFTRQLQIEAGHLDREYERKFAGMRTTLDGVDLYDVELANETMRQLGFPP